MNTSWEEDSEERIAHRKKSIENAILYKNQVYMINDDTIKKYLHNFTEEKAALIKDMAKTLGRDSLVNQQCLIMSRTRSVESFQTYKIPTLILCSEKDELTPVSIHKNMHNALQNSSLVVLKDCGHLSPIDCPNEVTMAIKNFLEKEYNC